MMENQKKWIDGVLPEVFEAIVAAPKLREAMIFKGARILNIHLKTNRQSLDIDSNIAPSLQSAFPDIESQAAFLKQHLPLALRRHFEQQNPVRFSLLRIRVQKYPPAGHPRGWNALWVRITVQDNHYTNQRALPAIEIDVAAPELLGPTAVQTITLFGFPAQVYSLERIAGEKLRAYLTSLPAYREKMGGGLREFRVKDLHDIARILLERPSSDWPFWSTAANEFRLACQSRLVDCHGLDSFMEDWTMACERYGADDSLRGVTLADAEKALRIVVGLFDQQKIFPLLFPIAGNPAQAR
ncbi:MAG: nucleotidyl transferase AbiEii/AbiGii toxin family protein [Verrucomicrobiota bacterium]